MNKVKWNHKRQMRLAWILLGLLTTVVCSFLVIIIRGDSNNAITLTSGIALFCFYIIGSLRVFKLPVNLSIPVLNYHSITPSPAWLRIGDQIAISPVAFNRQLKYLHRMKYKTLTISELNKNWDEIHERRKHERLIVLTFDDGYADNWKYVFPLLQGYAMKGTIFISSDFVSDTPVETAVNSKTKSLNGYLSWEQMRRMMESGLIEIQAHGKTHTRVFYSHKIAGFHNPGYENIWLFWNHRPENKRDWWFHDLSSFALPGAPLYPQQPALCVKKFIPDQNIVEKMQTYAQEQAKNKISFWKENWKKVLLNKYNELTGNNDLKAGVYETDYEYRNRVKDELKNVRDSIIQNLEFQPTAICWPENNYSEEVITIAKECRFEISVSNRHNGRNSVEDNRTRISRLFVGARFFGFKSEFLDFIGFWITLKCYEGYYIWYPVSVLGTILRKILISRKMLSPFIPLRKK